VIRARAPNALVCADPFHVVKLASEALDALRRQDWQRLRKEDPERAVWLKGTRFVLRRRTWPLAASTSDRWESGNVESERERMLAGEGHSIRRIAAAACISHVRVLQITRGD
jgi:transposase